ncbi:glycosyltransferase [Alphaproteobacteria bacterium]|nr:glycosyltransferase [Alphaproteobacteria bacterium]
MKSSHVDVTFILGSLGIGGVERVTIAIANYLVSQGKCVHLVVLTNQDMSIKSEIEKGVNIRIFNSKRVSASLLQLKRYIVKNNPDCIFSAMEYVNIVCGFACILSRYSGRLILSERIDIVENHKQKFNSRLKICSYLVPFIYKRANKLHFISKGVSESFFNYYGNLGNPHVIIHNPISAFTLLDIKKQRFKNKKSNVVRILAIGRLVKQKNFSTLIKSIAKLKNTLKMDLTIVGDGVEKDKLKLLVKSLEIDGMVKFVGFQTNVLQYYLSAEIFVMSSIWEGFGNVIVEALAAGCKVVSTDCPSGPAEILENGRWGELCEINNVDSLAEAIYKCHNSSYEAGSVRALNFSIEKIGKEYERLLFNED